MSADPYTPGLVMPHPEPPDPPELPRGADPLPRWPAWYAPAAFVTAFFAATVAFAVLAAAAGADLDDLSPEVTLGGTILQDAVLLAAAWGFAALTRRPRPWHFGLRRTRVWPAIGWASLGFVAFFVFAALYAVLLDPEGEQTVTEDLGADESQLLLWLSGVVIVVVAPFVEEIFFRGFFYRALRSRFSIWWAALIDGLVFGLIHFTGSDTLTILPVLAALGIMFCLVYERTGSLYPVIALHAFNNTIAFGVAEDAPDGAAPVAVSLGALTIALCFLLPRFTARSAPAVT